MQKEYCKYTLTLFLKVKAAKFLLQRKNFRGLYCIGESNQTITHQPQLDRISKRLSARL